MKHPTCEELGIDPDQMWKDFLNLEKTGTWPEGRTDWPEKVLAAYNSDWSQGLILMEIWCRQERVRILELWVKSLTEQNQNLREALLLHCT